MESLDPATFLGVPIAGFENGGRQQFILLLEHGLEPSSKVVDIGCGILRAGYWLIHFLDPGCYHGIEPHGQRIEIGRATILEAETLESKRPRFDRNATFDTSVFETRFDFFLAYSIWTHAAKPQIEQMLDNFTRDSSPEGLFLASILPAGWRKPDYQGSKWFGTSHESGAPGCIYHDLKWLRAACRRRDLHLRELGRERDGQTWLSISRDNRDRLLFRTIWKESLWRRLARRLLARWNPA